MLDAQHGDESRDGAGHSVEYAQRRISPVGISHVASRQNVQPHAAARPGLGRRSGHRRAHGRRQCAAAEENLGEARIPSLHTNCAGLRLPIYREISHISIVSHDVPRLTLFFVSKSSLSSHGFVTPSPEGGGVTSSDTWEEDMMDRNPPMPRLRTVFISDIHLGFKGCSADLLLDFL